MMKKIVIMLIILCLSACASTNYKDTNVDEIIDNKESSQIYSKVDFELTTLSEADLDYIEQIFKERFKHEFEIIFVYDKEIKQHNYFYAVIQEQEPDSYPIGIKMSPDELVIDAGIVDKYYSSHFDKRCNQVFKTFFRDYLQIDLKVAVEMRRPHNYGIELTDEELLNFDQDYLYINFAIETKNKDDTKKIIDKLNYFLADLQDKGVTNIPTIVLFVVKDLDTIKTTADLVVRNLSENVDLYNVKIGLLHEPFDYLQKYYNYREVEMKQMK